jgi:hypothetical protein
LNNQTWVKYENSNFNYTIEFPETPRVETRKTPSLLGLMVPAEAVSGYEYSSPSRSNMFMLSCTTFPETIVEENDSLGLGIIFDTLRERLLNRFKGELVFERDVMVEGFLTREFRIEFENEDLEGVNHITYRVFIKDNLQFIFQIITDKSKPSQASIDRFLNSFAFTDR